MTMDCRLRNTTRGRSRFMVLTLFTAILVPNLVLSTGESCWTDDAGSYFQISLDDDDLMNDCQRLLKSKNGIVWDFQTKEGKVTLSHFSQMSEHTNDVPFYTMAIGTMDGT